MQNFPTISISHKVVRRKFTLININNLLSVITYKKNDGLRVDKMPIIRQ